MPPSARPGSVPPRPAPRSLGLLSGNNGVCITLLQPVSLQSTLQKALLRAGFGASYSPPCPKPFGSHSCQRHSTPSLSWMFKSLSHSFFSVSPDFFPNTSPPLQANRSGRHRQGTPGTLLSHSLLGPRTPCSVLSYQKPPLPPPATSRMALPLFGSLCVLVGLH